VSAFIAALGLVITGNIAAAETFKPIKPGDILIADSNGAIMKFEPRSGGLTLLASGWPLVQPFAITVDAQGRIVVTDTGSRAVIRINPAQGTREIVAAIPGLPFGLAVNDAGDIFVANAETVLRIKAGTKSASMFAAGNPLKIPLGVAVAPDGNLFVADASGCVVKVDTSNRAKTLISRGQPLAQPVGIAFDASGDLLVADSVAACVVRINPTTRIPRVISQGVNLRTPVSVGVEKDGSILTGDPDAFGFVGGIIRVDPVSGIQIPLMHGQGDYANPRGFVVIRTGQVNRRN